MDEIIKAVRGMSRAQLEGFAIEAARDAKKNKKAAEDAIEKCGELLADRVCEEFDETDAPTC